LRRALARATATCMTLAPVPWRDVFGNERAVEVEIGPGRGETLLAYAAATAGTNFFAIERATRAADAILLRAARLGLANVRVVAGDARCIVACLVPDASVAAYHIYFPDPWPKTRHRGRRLPGDAFARDLVRTLAPGGAVEVASDLGPLVETFSALLARAGLVLEPGTTSRTRPTTSFERKYATAGTHYARLRREEERGGSGSRSCGRLI
jgi:tRNA (guanine-N7-)-methyltransferase